MPIFDRPVSGRETLSQQNKGRYHEFANLYSVCSFLWDACNYGRDMQPMLEDPSTPLEIRQNLFERLLNTVEASYGILNRRVNIIELLTRKDDKSRTADEPRCVTGGGLASRGWSVLFGILLRRISCFRVDRHG